MDLTISSSSFYPVAASALDSIEFIMLASTWKGSRTRVVSLRGMPRIWIGLHVTEHPYIYSQRMIILAISPVELDGL